MSASERLNIGFQFILTTVQGKKKRLKQVETAVISGYF